MGLTAKLMIFQGSISRVLLSSDRKPILITLSNISTGAVILSPKSLLKTNFADSPWHS